MPQMCPTCSHDNEEEALNCVSCHDLLRGLLGQNRMLNNRYQVKRVLGCGAMGAVYLAEDTRMNDRLVAIKENLQTAPQAETQFQHEVKLMIGLRHPNLPSVSDQFTGTTSRQYLVMDYIEGENLQKVVSQRGPLPEREVVALTKQLLDALAYLHQHSIIHRDIKPANIKLTPNGQAVLVDFGISKVHTPGNRTHSWGRGIGSPGFAALEQYGRGTNNRSDLYSLGAVMYYMLTGQVPPEAPDLAVGTPLLPPRQIRPHLSPQIERVVLKAMALNLGQRYISADQIHQELVSPPASQPYTRTTARLPPPFTCSACGRLNDTHEIYCQGCGNQLYGRRPCGYCRYSIPANAAFCTNCGRKVFGND